jgi:hypothetical protein
MSGRPGSSVIATNAARAPAAPPNSTGGGLSQAVSSWLVVNRSRMPPGGIAAASATWRRTNAAAVSPRHTALRRP